MKRWAALTVALYLLSISVLTSPLIFFVSSEAEELLPWFYVSFVPFMVLVQVALLLVPVAAAEGRPIKRRTVLSSAIVTAFPMGVMAMAIVMFLLFMIVGESGPEFLYEWPLLVTLVGSWLAWGMLFYRKYQGEGAGAFTATVTNWLLKGSILEMVVAVPSHIISRQRDDCCAPGITLIGLATGLSVALMAFGPGVFLLFAKRIKDKRRATR